MGSKLTLVLRVWASLGNGGPSRKGCKMRCLQIGILYFWKSWRKKIHHFSFFKIWNCLEIETINFWKSLIKNFHNFILLWWVSWVNSVKPELTQQLMWPLKKGGLKFWPPFLLSSSSSSSSSFYYLFIFFFLLLIHSPFFLHCYYS